MQQIPAAELVEQLRRLGVVRGDVLLVHTSFRAVRPVEGGPEGLIEALKTAIGPEGTLVMPTMTDGESIFDPTRTPTLEMGIAAELFWRMPGVVRSPHPGASFAAFGPQAARICAWHPLAPPHGLESPVGRVYELGGKVLLLGVDHSEDTTLHLAEAIADVPYSIEHPCVVEVDGHATTVLIPETDHCCMGFNQLNAWLDEAKAQRHGHVGYAQAKLATSRAIVEAALKRLRVDPLVFLCHAGMGCHECDLARASVA